jgi:hypothetical protein
MQYTMAAAEWGVAAGAAVKSIASALGGRSAEAGGYGATISAGGRATAGGTQVAAAERAQPTVQIIFQGPVYGGQAGLQEITKAIGQGVQKGTMVLPASYAIRPTLSRVGNR